MSNYAEYMKNLPVIPEVAIKILSIAEDNVEISFHDLEEIIKIDPALTSKVLKVANSALYARQSQITNLSKAISLLGFKTIKSLVLIISAASAFKVEGKLPFYRSFWKNCVLTAFYSKELALNLFDKFIAEDVFLAGLIHRIGQVALFRYNPEYYQEILDHSDINSVTLSDLERNYYDIDHRNLGADILKSWSFPDIFIDCAKEYGYKNIISKYKKEVILISIADLITSETINNIKIDMDKLGKLQWLEFLGLTESVFIDIKKEIIENLAKNPEYKECELIFSNL